MTRDLLLVVPARNEERALPGCVEALDALRRRLASDDVALEVLVVINNCSDRTLEVGSELAAVRPWLSVEETSGRGKGLAVRHGWSRGRDLVAFTDADLAADIDALPGMVAELRQGSADLVIASRYVERPWPNRSRQRAALSSLYRFASRHVLRLPVRDAQCGLKAALHAHIEPVLDRCEETGWLLDSEMLFWAHRAGLRISEVKVSWREGPTSNLRVVHTAVEVLRFLRRLRRQR